MTSFPFFLLLNDEEIAKAIRSINRGQSADYHGLTIEHIINAGKDMEKLLLLITNPMFVIYSCLTYPSQHVAVDYFIECCFGVKLTGDEPLVNPL
jgi:hypothetical protein